MSESSIDGVYGFTQGDHRVTVLVEGKRTGEVDSRGREEWTYRVVSIAIDKEGGTHETDEFDGTIHWDPAYGQYGLLSRIFSAVHLRVVERDSDEYMQRKATNND